MLSIRLNCFFVVVGRWLLVLFSHFYFSPISENNNLINVCVNKLVSSVIVLNCIQLMLHVETEHPYGSCVESIPLSLCVKFVCLFENAGNFDNFRVLHVGGMSIV